MIFSRIPIIRALMPSRPDAAVEVARRWVRAAQADPKLQTDLIGMGGLLTLRAATYVDGEVLPEPIDPVRLAYEQGQRDMTVKLLALMGVTPLEFNKLSKENHLYD